MKSVVRIGANRKDRRKVCWSSGICAMREVALPRISDADYPHFAAVSGTNLRDLVSVWCHRVCKTSVAPDVRHHSASVRC